MAEAKKEEEKKVKPYRYRNEVGVNRETGEPDEFAIMRQEAIEASQKKSKTASEIRQDEDDKKNWLETYHGGRRRKTRKVRIPIKHEGDLKKLGYSMGKSARSRHASLKKAVKRYGRLSTSRKLNALAVFNKRRHPLTARKARADRKFVME